ncbi:Pentatricopeptide repeat-containing protein [Sesamum angolense]|uniref:Pentatricopeptide repeat-containing protein n=1 Tax=Sesamum angolense TaxID=2727404 RepID=A0AAE1W6Y6_9LAMI|nr:Pentatricopeptide repeat-containing protein [Sesamum angolense]
MMRLAVRLKPMRNSFWEWRTSESGRKSAAGFVEGWRSLATSNGSWLRESIARPMQEAIVNALHMGERSRASHLLSELGREGQALQAADFISILQYCARTPDPLFVMETWKLMEEKDVELNGRCYFLTIRALSKGGYFKEAFNILSVQTENSDIYPTLPVYNNLLEACVQVNSLNHASECLNLMEQKEVGKNAITYFLLLKLAVLRQDLSAVRDIWKEYINCHTPGIITLRKFIWSFTRLRDLDSAYVALQQMIAMALHPKFRLTKNAEGRLSDLMLDIPIPCRNELTLNGYAKNNCTSIPSVAGYCDEKYTIKGFKFGMEAKKVEADGFSLSKQPISEPVVKLLRWSFGDLIHTCANSQNVLLAEQLMLQMQNLGLEPSCSTYNGFIRALVSVKGFPDGMEVLKVMQQKNMKLHDSTLAALSVSCSRGLELDLAEAFLSQISKCHHTYPFNAFLEACDILDKPERAVRVLAKMKHLKILPDVRTYERLFSLFGNVNAPYEDGNMISQFDAAKRINAIEMDMMRNGIQHSQLSMQNLLKAVGMEGMTKELIQYLSAAEGQFLHRSTNLGTHIYNTVLHSLVEAKESHVAIKIFRSMISCGVSPTAASYDIMIDCCSITKCYRSACAMISIMVREGFYPTAVTYTSLIKSFLRKSFVLFILLKFEDFDEALKLLHQAILEGIQPDLVLYNTILQAASEKGRIYVIELIVEQMHQDKIQPDPSTCSHVFSAYANNGFHSCHGSLASFEHENDF